MRLVSSLVVICVILHLVLGEEIDNNTQLPLLTTTLPTRFNLSYETNFTTDLNDDGEDSTDSGNDDETVPFKAPQDALEFMDYFEGLLKKVQTSLDGVFDQYLPQLFEMSSSVTLSSDCTYDIVRVILALREMKPWAIKRKFLKTCGSFPFCTYIDIMIFSYHYRT